MPNRPWRENEVVEAIFDTDNPLSQKYRYLLTCTWDNELAKVVFVMLNPSVGDFQICDPTLDKCSKFAKNWGYGGFNIVNLFALISTDPYGLKEAVEPIGKDNDKFILQAVKEADKVIFAWGEKYGKLHDRDKQVVNLLSEYKPQCIKKTKKGNHPRHPLYLSKDLMPIPY